MPVQIDMEMPRSCGDCRFCRTEVFGCVYCDAYENYGKEISPCTKLQLFAGRKDWCPLVETEDRTWHVVTDGDLPEEKGFYQCTVLGNHKDEVFIADVYKGAAGFFYDNELYEVIAWRELPVPWEERKEND